MDNQLLSLPHDEHHNSLPDRSRVLFLDINGVLDSPAWYKRENDRIFAQTGVRKPLVDVLDPTSIKLLDNIIERTNASIVITSAWREHYGLDGTVARLEDAGFNYLEHVIGCTGNVHEGQSGRGKEVLEWLEQRPGITHWCVVDDYRFDIPKSNKFDFSNRIQITNGAIGLTARDVEIIVRVLTIGSRFPVRNQDTNAQPPRTTRSA